MSPAARRTRNILLIIIGGGSVVLAGLAYVFWPSLVLLLDPRRTGAHSIPSESMAPTLLPGDYVVTLRTDPAEIRRGTVIVFKLADADRVSRVAALPGDTIELRKGVVYINGRPVPQRSISPGPALEDKVSSAILGERFPGETRSHRILDRGESQQDDFPATVVPPGSLFVLGDNRDNTADSRFAVTEMGAGMVAFRQVVGRVESLYWARDRTRVGMPIDPMPGSN